MPHLHGALVVQKVHHRTHRIPLDLLGQHKVVQQVEERGCDGPVQHLQRIRERGRLCCAL